ncbi:unnamed protein product [Cuscuta campestris]|uniref:RNase H type-1 domain-containing protein n=1 Tax=Cuscuta campestris TaxID=132261 RepID=A0A484LRZ6_9ASTE|nr:unnamed protein product [Cuscuta campestris]
MPHLCMKFHTPGGVGEVKGDQRNARECYAQVVKKMTKGVNVISQEITKGETREKLEPKAETVEIEFHPEGFKIYHAIVFNFKLTNNEAEYEALAGGLRLAQALKISRVSIKSDSSLIVGQVTEYEALAGGLRLAQALKISRVSIKSDSSLIVGQVTGNMEAREGRMAQYKDLVLAPLKGFEEFKIAQIPRAENADADLLSRLTQEAERVIAEVHEGVCAAHQMSRTLSQRIILLGYYWPTIVQDCERRAHGETPFSLTYGCEARLPIEAEFPTFRESNYQPQQNEEDHLAELNLVEERRMAAEVKMSTYQQVVKKYHDNKVGPRYFQVGDEVLRRREASRPGDGGKLAKN